LFSQAVPETAQAARLAPVGAAQQASEEPEAAAVGESVPELLAALPQYPAKVSP